MSDVAISRTAVRLYKKIEAWRDHAKKPLVRGGELCICLTHDQLAEALHTSVRTIERRVSELRRSGMLRVSYGPHPYKSGIMKASFFYLNDDEWAAFSGKEWRDQSRQNGGTKPAKMSEPSYSNTKNTVNEADAMDEFDEVPKAKPAKTKGSGMKSLMKGGSGKSASDLVQTSASFQEPTEPEFDTMGHKEFEKLWRFHLGKATGVTQSPFGPPEKAMAKAAVKKMGGFSEEEKREIVSVAVSEWAGIRLRLKQANKKSKALTDYPHVQTFLGRLPEIAKAILSSDAQEKPSSVEESTAGVDDFVDILSMGKGQ